MSRLSVLSGLRRSILRSAKNPRYILRCLSDNSDTNSTPHSSDETQSNLKKFERAEQVEHTSHLFVLPNVKDKNIHYEEHNPRLQGGPPTAQMHQRTQGHRLLQEGFTNAQLLGGLSPPYTAILPLRVRMSGGDYVRHVERVPSVEQVGQDLHQALHRLLSL